MPLPSQFSQPKSRRSHMYRRRGPGRRRVLIVLLILLGLSVGVWLMRSSNDSGTTAEADASVAETPDENYMARDIGAQQITMGQPVQTSVSRRSPERAASSSASEPQPEPSERESRSSSEQTDRPTNDNDGASDQRDRERERNRSRTASSSGPSSASPAQRERAMKRMEAGIDLLRSNQPVEARRILTHALESAGMDEANAHRIREKLTELNQRLIFSPEIVDNDPFTYGYTIRPGDSLARIRSRENLAIDWRFIQRINRISRPERIQVGQNLKLVTGPFHAIVHKSDYRIDLYLGEGSERVYVRSFPVGLGEYNSTPIGQFRVSKNSKLIDPAWTNPRTGEQFKSGDPENPIGTRWIGMEGVSEAIRGLTGYGIHGTIEPDSIGQQQSMGCIRLHTEDVELVYELLAEEISTVKIVE